MEESIFRDRVALVTGAGSGIGRATAELLARQGAQVACADINAEGLQQTVSNIRSAGGDANAIECNVSDSKSVDQMVQSCVDQFGGLSILANVAGVLAIEHTHLTEDAVWDRVMGVNLNGTFYASRAAIPHLLEATEGTIVNVASLAGLMGQAYCAAYCSSKAALLSMTQCLHYDLEDSNVKIFALSPGFTQTDMVNDIYANPVFRAAALTPEQGQPPERPARVLAWLAREAPADLAGVHNQVQFNDLTRRAGIESV